ncbi:hypothetical protein J6590_105884, partial [Homalodisca vitripennis]
MSLDETMMRRFCRVLLANLVILSADSGNSTDSRQRLSVTAFKCSVCAITIGGSLQ